jgi:flavin reductase (DIM6/NTAB) family NADH-FMN oxidoreductase RutF
VADTGEFVVNIVSEAVAEQMNITSTDLDPDVNEFELAGVTPIPSQIVRPPRVQESPISIECTLNQIVTISDQPGGGAIVIGTVVYMHVAEDVYIPDYKIDTTKLQPVGRLAGPNYSRTRDIFQMPRPAPQLSRQVRDE